MKFLWEKLFKKSLFPFNSVAANSSSNWQLNWRKQKKQLLKQSKEKWCGETNKIKGVCVLFPRYLFADKKIFVDIENTLKELGKIEEKEKNRQTLLVYGAKQTA